MSKMGKSNFYIGMGMGLVVGGCTAMAMHSKSKKQCCPKNALGRTLRHAGEVVDSISNAMGW